MGYLTADEAIALLEEAVEQAGSQRRYAMRHQLNANLIGSILKGHVPLSAPSVLRAMGLRRIVLYEREETQ
jgi:hypothetical protein